ncbi:SAM-dependent DNA methyltransferase [Paludisphaera rhizosphaerae]|uniref:SAM-dependent DNA methyltransferase n=1 Tax=Paludisphaera rhizosphaerae TaxID=2711216 RepID=UPI0013EB1E63|nr:SAM-dependent DNA methyltransferase [Paludisphaera rhizosphaerae]
MGKKEFGDFQTPPELAEALVKRLGPIGGRWARVLEPTCGRGNFLRAVLDSPHPPREAIGIERQSAYCNEARAALNGRATILEADLFGVDLSRLPWSGDGPILIVGNPPWVTSAELGRLGSLNLPAKRNVKGLEGLEARTGSANFDLGEAVWLKLLAKLSDQPATIALLCKSAVARAVLDHARRLETPITAELIEIDARRWFGAAVSACFLILALGRSNPTGRIAVFPNLEATAPVRTMGVVRGRFATDYETALAHEDALGGCPREWRQGVKHDAAPVVELTADGPGGPLRNGLGEVVDVEPEWLYPLVKGADLKRPARERPRRALIVTQRKLGDDTTAIATEAPRLWAYLNAHADRFARRRSSIYDGRPPFAMFGIGPYSFAPYKVAVAGVHRPARFRAVGLVAGKPIVLDDTCYLLPCSTAAEAAVLAALGNDPITLELLRAFAAPGSKRPVTKAVLQAIDPTAVLRMADRRAVVARGVETLVEDLQSLETNPEAMIESAIESLAPLLSPSGDPTLGRFDPESEPPHRSDEET